MTEKNFYLGQWIVKPSENKLVYKNKSIKIEPRSMALLICLSGTKNKTISRQQLLQDVWKERLVNEDALTTSISKLRTAFRQYQPDLKVIETIPREGYRLLLPYSAQAIVESNRSPFIRIGLLLISIIAIMSGIFWQLTSLPKTPSYYDKPASIKPSGIHPDQVRMPSFSPDGKSIAYQKRVNGQWQIFISEVNAQTDRQMTSFDVINGAPAPAWSHDGRNLLISRYHEGQCEIYLISVISGELTQLLSCQYNANVGLAFSNDNQEIYYSNRGQQNSSSHPIFKYNLTTRKTSYITQPKSGEFDFAPKISPDGSTLAFLKIRKGQKPNIALLNLTTLESKILTEENEVIDMAWTPQGNIAYIARHNGQKDFWVIDLDGKKSWLGIQDINASSLTICPKTQGIAYTTTQEINSIVRIPLLQNFQQKNIETVVKENKRVWFPMLSPDNKQLVFSSGRLGELQLWKINVDGSQETQLTFDQSISAFEPSWSPDGKTIAYVTSVFGESKLCLLSTTTRSTPQCIQNDLSKKRAPHWSKDKRFLYYASNRENNWAVWQYDLSERKAQKLPIESANNVHITPSGKTFYYTHINHSGIWQWDETTNQGKKVIADLSSLQFRDWQLIDDTIYYINTKMNLMKYNTQTQENQRLGKIKGHHQHSGLTISNDRQWAYLSIIKKYATNIMYSHVSSANF